jgi:APA family basic amino acid/polyamine antiporter
MTKVGRAGSSFVITHSVIRHSFVIRVHSSFVISRSLAARPAPHITSVNPAPPPPPPGAGRTPTPPPMTPAPQQSLPRVLGVWMASAVVVGTTIGSGVFKKAHNVADNVPEFGLAISVWVVGGLLTIFGALAYAEIAVRYPRAGGNYVYLREAYGRGAGFLWGWVDFTIIRSASIAVLAYMTTEALHDALRQSLNPPHDRTAEILGFWTRQAMTVGVIALLTAVNARGTRLGGGVQMALTVLKLGSLAGLGLLPVAVYFLAPDAEARPTTAHMAPIWPEAWSLDMLGKYGVALVGVLWAYHGWMNIGPIAEEVKNPNRNIPHVFALGC